MKCREEKERKTSKQNETKQNKCIENRLPYDVRIPAAPHIDIPILYDFNRQNDFRFHLFTQSSKAKYLREHIQCANLATEM